MTLSDERSEGVHSERSRGVEGLNREQQIKGWTREKKGKLIRGEWV